VHAPTTTILEIPQWSTAPQYTVLSGVRATRRSAELCAGTWCTVRSLFCLESWSLHHGTRHDDLPTRLVEREFRLSCVDQSE